jgi:ABC-type Fe3+ transport system permease subunit
VSIKSSWFALLLLVSLVCAWLPLAPSIIAFFDFPQWLGSLDSRVLLLLWRSIWMSSAAAIISLAIGWPLGIILGRFRFIGSSTYLLLLPLSLMLPPLMVAQAWYGLLGISGPWAAVFSFACSYAPLPALLVIRSLNKQAASSYDTARMLSPKLSLRLMLSHTRSAALVGAALCFIFSIGDFAVPDYFATVGDLFHVYSSEVFGNSRNSDFRAGAVASLPLILISIGLLFSILPWLKNQQHYSGQACAQPHAPRKPRTLSAISLLFISMLVFAIIGRMLYESGMRGPLATATWFETSSKAFYDAFSLGRSDMIRTFQFAGLGSLICLAFAPLWAFAIHYSKGMRRNVLFVILVLPMLVPSLCMAFGSIMVFNQPYLDSLYNSILLPAMLIAGRFMPIAVLICLNALGDQAAAIDASAYLHKLSIRQRVYSLFMRNNWRACVLGAALVFVFAMRELDFAILLPAANQSTAVRYYNALHFSRDNFVAAFGLSISFILFLPIAFSAWLSKGSNKIHDK